MNRLTRHFNLVDLLPRCQACGSSDFNQKELRKTGVKVTNNQFVYVGEEPTSDVGFVCAKCGKLMPAKDTLRLVKSPGFKSLFKIIKPKPKFNL